MARLLAAVGFGMIVLHCLRSGTVRCRRAPHTSRRPSLTSESPQRRQCRYPRSRQSPRGHHRVRTDSTAAKTHSTTGTTKHSSRWSRAGGWWAGRRNVSGGRSVVCAVGLPSILSVHGGPALPLRLLLSQSSVTSALPPHTAFFP